MTGRNIASWLADRKKISDLHVEFIEFNKSEQWHFTPDKKKLVHKSGKFFTIEGLVSESTYPGFGKQYQPIINQPEIGILGIVFKKAADDQLLLMQAKAEPGNINTVQLAPTLQATKSNYTRVHGGKQQEYFELLENSQKKLVYDTLQSEQGTMFFRKRNRNILLELNTDEELEPLAAFRWLSYRQILPLLKKDNLVNSDARSVLAVYFLNYGVSLFGKKELNKFQRELLKSLQQKSTESGFVWIKKLRRKYKLQAKLSPLNKLPGWTIGNDKITNKLNKTLEVRQIRVKIQGREVTNWDQPIVLTSQKGILVLLTKKINGTLCFLLNEVMEPGIWGDIEITGSIQTNNNNLHDENNLQTRLYKKYVIEKTNSQKFLEVENSEEGGRFYHDVNKYIFIRLNDTEELDLPETYFWATLAQLKEFINKDTILTNELRSQLAILFSQFS